MRRFEKKKLAEGCSQATIDSYCRNLRSVINYFTHEVKLIPKDYQYPFGKGGYNITSFFPKKQVMSNEETKRVVDFEDFANVKKICIIFYLYGNNPYICIKHNTMVTLEKKARFDTRISKEQKLLFEKAAYFGGYRSLSDFIILTAQQRAKEIIEERERIIVSKRDSDIFFEAITNPGNPNKELIKAAEKYKAKLP